MGRVNRTINSLHKSKCLFFCIIKSTIRERKIFNFAKTLTNTMKYYTTSFITESNKTGDYPQIIGANNNYPFNKPTSYKKLNYYEFPEEQPNMNGIVLSPKAKLTPILTCLGATYSVGFFINQQLKEILSQSSIENFHYYPVILEQNKTRISNYEFIHIIYGQDFIDIVQSEFAMLDVQSLSTPPESISINSMEEWEEKYPLYYREKKRNIVLSKVKLKKELDLFRIPFSNTLYISEKLIAQFNSLKNVPLKYDEPWVKFI
jgi:hypothetical protein